MKNPWCEFNRYRYAWDMVPDQAGTVLDYGCFNGEFLSTLQPKAGLLTGIDVNEDALFEAKKRYPECKFLSITTAQQQTPFGDDSFDVVILLEVLEHVPDERVLLQEISRILKPEGILILSTPHKGLFWFWDIGNIKFKFPWLHRAIYLYVLGKKEEYEQRFSSGKYGLYGDVSISEHMYHKHYPLQDVLDLLAPHFEVKILRRFGLFHRIIDTFHSIYKILSKKESGSFFVKLDSWDESKEWGWAADGIILSCINKK